MTISKKFLREESWFSGLTLLTFATNSTNKSKILIGYKSVITGLLFRRFIIMNDHGFSILVNTLGLASCS